MKLLYFIFFVTTFNNIYGQSFDDPFQYFPINSGNMWEYDYFDFGYHDTLQTVTIKDSIDNFGKKFVWNISNFINPIKPPVLIQTNYFVIDSFYNVRGYYENIFTVLYKLNANQGDKWVLRNYPSGGFEMVRVDSILSVSLFNQTTLIKKFRYYYTSDSTQNYGLDRYADYLAYNIGLIHVDGLEGLGMLNIKGAIIDNVLFGDTTKIISGIIPENNTVMPVNFILFQNYPNPFNSSTNFRIVIYNSTTLYLEIFDILGNKIRTIVDNSIYSPGTYELTWDGKDNFHNPKSSGVYLCKIYDNTNSITKKIILLK